VLPLRRLKGQQGNLLAFFTAVRALGSKKFHQNEVKFRMVRMRCKKQGLGQTAESTITDYPVNKAGG
jgi:hypothetical protein